MANAPYIIYPFLIYRLLFYVGIDIIDATLLRKQQICLGLLKAVRVLLSPQDHLRKIILSSENVKVEASGLSDEQTLFQQLMKTAVKPSPIKPIFGREELEV